ncbi:MAG: 3'-5' exonuclease [Pyrinomonadaceae bacterium]
MIVLPYPTSLPVTALQHILVDEYQDTNRLQAETIDLLAVKHRNVMVVGDDAQSIFAWRGAEFTNVYEFPKRYPEAALYKLETNYRSTPEILGLANTSIACNCKQFPKTERFKEPQPLVGEEVVSGGEEDELLTLTSVHQAKGLEWKAVFIIWAAEGKFPSPRSLREIENEEEERRLWYVALTRAKDELYLTYPLMITDYNRQTVLQKPSRFISECPAALFEIWNLEEEEPVFPAHQLSSPATDEYIN